MNTTLIQFTLLIPINTRLREFNFRKRSAEKYDCNTADERGERYYFTLIKHSNEWTIQEFSLPAWLKGHEGSIAKALAEWETKR